MTTESSRNCISNTILIKGHNFTFNIKITWTTTQAQSMQKKEGTSFLKSLANNRYSQQIPRLYFPGFLSNVPEQLLFRSIFSMASQSSILVVSTTFYLTFSIRTCKDNHHKIRFSNNHFWISDVIPVLSSRIWENGSRYNMTFLQLCYNACNSRLIFWNFATF